MCLVMLLGGMVFLKGAKTYSDAEHAYLIVLSDPDASVEETEERTRHVGRTMMFWGGVMVVGAPLGSLLGLY